MSYAPFSKAKYAPDLKRKAAAELELRRRRRAQPDAGAGAAWRDTARPEQLAPPGAWRTWLLLAGRGFGKTRTINEWLIEQIETCPRVALVAATFADARDTLVEGESGLYTIHRSAIETWNRSMGEIVFVNGARAKLFSSEQPDRLRGPQHYAAICDELAAWKRARETWDMLMLGLRLGANPRVAIATTPRPIPLVRELLRDAHTVVTRGSTYANRANLAPQFFDQIVARYAGTRLGRQELDAEILDDTPGALWTLALIEATRVPQRPDLLQRIVVGVDPPASREGAECGIVVDARGDDGHGYTLADASTQGTPAEWASAVIRAFVRHRADRIIAEKNQGGEMVEHVIRSTTAEIDGMLYHGANLPITLVWASRGKQTRAEPISALYEQRRWHHVGAHPELESQMCTWVPGETSPDRMDAHVWAATELFPNEVAAAVPPPAATLTASQLFGRRA